MLLVIIGAIIIPHLGSLGNLNLEEAILFLAGSGVGVIFGGVLLVINKKGGGGLGIGGSVMSFIAIIMSVFSDAPVANPPAPWFMAGSGLAILGSILGLATSTEYKIVQERDRFMEETLKSFKETLFEEFNVVKIEFIGRQFGALLFLVEFKDNDGRYKRVLISNLENLMNQRVILTSKMIPDSAYFKDDMYYLDRVKHGILKTTMRRITIQK